MTANEEIQNELANLDHQLKEAIQEWALLVQEERLVAELSVKYPQEQASCNWLSQIKDAIVTGNGWGDDDNEKP
jgi:hypothetical protein